MLLLHTYDVELYAAHLDNEHAHKDNSPGKTVLITLQNKLRTRNNGERSRPAMADEVASFIVIKVNFTDDVRG